MPTVKNNFVAGKLNTDIDERLLKKGEYKDALNINIANSNGSDVGAIEKSLSNQKITNLSLGTNAHTIGGTSDEFEDKLYWFVKSDSGSYIIEYAIKTNTTSFVLKDTRISSESVLAFDKNYLITGIRLIIDTDNNSRFLVFTDNNTQPKCINIERAKTYGENGFEEADILLIKKPPLNAPEITLIKTNISEENNIKEKFLRFGYRYKYLDNEYSAFSPLSEIAFKPKSFSFDYSTSTNESMENEYNKVDIQFNSGSKLVKEIEVFFIESGKNIPYIIENYNKETKNWDHNAPYSVPFANNKIYKTLSEKQLFRLFDGVPLKAKALEVINNVLVFGNYIENWDLIDQDNAKINLDLSLNLISEDVTAGASYKSNKSNRDIEVGLVYGEKYGRHTTVLTSENNTVYIPVSACNKKNSLKLVINNKPPKFAEWYRVFIKQNKYDYDTIIPTLFYENEAFVWLKLEVSDIDKIKEGDFLIVKSDTERILSSYTETKIIEIKEQNRNFLEEDTTITTLKQQPGTYFKIKPKNFRLNIQDIDLYEHTSYEDNLKDGSTNPIGNNINYIQKPVFYGVGLDDLSKSGTYTGTEDIRYFIEIDQIGDGVTSFDTFKWGKNNGGYEASNETIQINTPQLLENGVSITFANNSGHSASDKWYIGAKSATDHGYGSYQAKRGYAIYKGPDDEVIYGGARIEIIYDEYDDEIQKEEILFTSSKRYENIEEWFYGDNISLGSIPEDRIWFRRGNVVPHGWRNRSHQINMTNDESGTMNMIIKSLGYEGGTDVFGLIITTDSPVRIKVAFTIRQSENNVLFETKAKNIDSDIFYEIGKTYPIINGYHTSTSVNDQNQTTSLAAEIMLPSYNCFGWGNGFESIKIKDLFNAKSLSIQTRPNAPIENFGENKKIASLTYSQPYSQSLNYNGLNEFNISQNNSKDLDDAYGSLQAIKTFNTDLDVWQEDKTSRVLFGKTMLYNEDGSSNIAKSNLIFDTVVPYSGEFGISKQPGSLAWFGNYRYWLDSKRGVVLRKGQSGIEIISNFGMKNWFRDQLIYENPIQGRIDPYTKQYVVSIDTTYKPAVIAVNFPNGTCCQ